MKVRKFNKRFLNTMVSWINSIGRPVVYMYRKIGLFLNWFGMSRTVYRKSYRWCNVRNVNPEYVVIVKGVAEYMPCTSERSDGLNY